MRIFLLIIAVAILSGGCKPKQNSVAAPPAKPSPTASLPTGDELQVLNNLVISFYSTGEGVNQKAVETVENFLKEYSAKYPVPYSKVAWGREGEVDFCILLSQIEGDERRIFVDKVRTLVKGFELIHIYENQPCRELK
jgi:hypothetical protein